MLDRPPPPPGLGPRLRNAARNAGGVVVRAGWHRMAVFGAIGPTSRRARGFRGFGFGSVVSFPYESIVNESAITIGRDTVIAPYVTLSAGWMPDQPGLGEVVSIGDRCLIGRGSSIVGHESIVIGDDVWTGHNVHLTDMNHGYDDPDLPISRQHQAPRPISVGDGSWLGHNVVVLPGAQIGRRVVVGAGSVVTGALPDGCVAAGVPARVIRDTAGGRTV